MFLPVVYETGARERGAVVDASEGFVPAGLDQQVERMNLRLKYILDAIPR